MSTVIGLIGCGNMGAAIARGILGQPDSAAAKFSLAAADADGTKVQALAAQCPVAAVSSNRDLAGQADLLLLAVKPNQVRPVLEDLAPVLTPEKILVSIAAGITSAQLRQWSGGACPVVRVMPNTPVLVGKGLFAVCLDDPNMDQEKKALVRSLFAPVGQVFELPEGQFDAFTAVGGSGPAYVFYFMEACVEAAVALGLPRNTSTDIVKGLFSGSAELALQSQEHLGVLREAVTSPGGTTIAALNCLDSAAVRGIIIEAVKAACARSRELGG